MTTRETAEAAVYRSAAVRDLMATGATRAEAEAAVSEEVALRLHADLGRPSPRSAA